MPPSPASLRLTSIWRYCADGPVSELLRQYRLVGHLGSHWRHPDDARRLAAVHRTARPAAGRAAVPVQPAPTARTQGDLLGAVVRGQRGALAAVHHPADRADPHHRVPHRHLAGGGRRHSTAGDRCRAVLRPVGGNRPARGRPRHHRSDPGHGRDHPPDRVPAASATWRSAMVTSGSRTM